MIILVLITLVLSVGIAWLLVNEERPVLFPTPKPPTFLETVASFNIRIKELQVAFGTALLPAARHAAEVMTTFINQLKDSGLRQSVQGFCPVCGNVTYDGVCIVKGH